MKVLAKCFTIIFITLVTLSGCDDDIKGPQEQLLAALSGAFQNNLELINLYELPVIDEVELIKNLIN